MKTLLKIFFAFCPFLTALLCSYIISVVKHVSMGNEAIGLNLLTTLILDPLLVLLCAFIFDLLARKRLDVERFQLYGFAIGAGILSLHQAINLLSIFRS